MATSAMLSQAARRLEGKVAVITGGVCGIGESTARLFSKHGAKVIIADIRNDLGKSVCKDLGPETASFVQCDVSSESDIENAIATAVDKHGKLDIMVNNAAIGDPTKLNILNNDEADFERVISVNLTGVFLGSKHAARSMIPLRRGSIINVGSVSLSVGGVASHAYASSKHAIVGLTRNVAAELGRYGIRVNCLSPYFIRTPLTKEMFKFDENPEFRVYSNLDGATLQQEDVAEAACFWGAMSPSTSAATIWRWTGASPPSIPPLACLLVLKEKRFFVPLLLYPACLSTLNLASNKKFGEHHVEIERKPRGFKFRKSSNLEVEM